MSSKDWLEKDFYAVLSVPKTASPDEVKKAYRKLAMQFHPDRNHGDHDAADKFKECTEAFEVLSDPQKRDRYDRFGHAGVEGMPGGGADFGDLFGDLLGSFFGAGGGGRGEKQARLDARKTCRCPATVRVVGDRGLRGRRGASSSIGRSYS